LGLYQYLPHPKNCVNYPPFPPIKYENVDNIIEDVPTWADQYGWPIKNSHFAGTGPLGRHCILSTSASLN
jgi:hypothetical protein